MLPTSYATGRETTGFKGAEPSRLSLGGGGETRAMPGTRDRGVRLEIRGQVYLRFPEANLGFGDWLHQVCGADI